MTTATLLQIAWARKGWIAAPFAIATCAAALIGWGLASRVTYRSACNMTVKEGAYVDAAFSCRSLDVLDRVLERRAFEDVRRRCPIPARLAEQVTVTVSGLGVFRLEVDAPSADEAERLVGAIAAEAGLSVKVLADQISDEDQRRIWDLDEKLRQAQANVVEPKRELDELQIKYQFHEGPQGELVSSSRLRLTEMQTKTADLRRQLAGIDAEVAALKHSVDVAAGGRAEGSPSHGKPADARLIELDADIARLRESLTDEHPRLAKLFKERSRIEHERGRDLASPRGGGEGRASSGSLADGLRAALRAKEAERARSASVLAALEKERAELAEFVRTEAANAEGRARELTQRLESARVEVDRTSKLKAEEEDAAERSKAAHAALTPGRVEKAQLLGGGPSVGWLALAGAALGLMIGGLTAALAEALDPAIRSGDDVVLGLDLPVLATVPALGGGRGGARRAGTVAWLAVFFLTAAFLVMLVYPGWGRLRELLSPAGERRAAEGTVQ